MSRIARLENEIISIGDLSRDELIARWTRQFGCPPPKGIKNNLLERAAAWQLQSKWLGGLSANARRIMRQRSSLAKDGATLQGRGTARLNDRQSDGFDQSGSIEQQRPVRLRLVPKPGSRLLREWNGSTHVIEVIEAGFVLDGKTYKSLTAIAKRITGAHWSGPRFFGL